MLAGLSGVRGADRAQQSTRVGGVAEQVHGFLPAVEFGFRDHHDIAFPALPGHCQRHAIVHHFIEVAREVLAVGRCTKR